MKSIKIVLAISAILGIALLNSASAGAAKYTVEDVENNPDYRFLKQRLVRMEIDEDEEIDWGEFMKHIFRPSTQKCPIAKAIAPNINKLNPDMLNTGITMSDLKTKYIPSKDYHPDFYNPNNEIVTPPDKRLTKEIKSIQSNKGISSIKINAILSLTIADYYGGIFDVDPTSNTISNIHQSNLNKDGGKYAIELFNSTKKSDALTIIHKPQEREYLDIYNSPEFYDIGSCSFPGMYIFEEFDLIINRKSAQPQDGDKEDATSTKTEAPTPQDTVKETATTQQEVQQISAPNTGFSNFNPISILALLGLTSTATFIFRRK